MADTQYDLIDAEYVEVKDQRVYPNQRRPNSKTVAYYPLDAANQYNDCSGHNYHLTKNTYASQGNYGPNVECCYFNSRSNSSGACGLYRSTDRIFNSTDGEKKYTILFWIYFDGGNMYYNPRIVGRYNGEIIVYNGGAFGCYDTYNGPTMSSGSWNLIGANLDFNTKKISWYKNGEYVSTQTYPDGLATQADGIVIGTRDNAIQTNYGDKFSGYMGDVIVEQGLRDKDSHKRFYNQTRRKYHIFEEGDTIAYYPLTQDAKDMNVKNKFAPFDFTSSNVIFNENGVNLDGSTNLITRPYSFMHGDFPYTVCFSFKTNTITNTRGEFFSFMRDVSGTRAPLLSLRNATITLDYNGVAGGNFNFTAEANTWYRLVFLHKTARENELIINKVSCGTVNMSSDQNCGTNAMHIGQEMDNQSRFNGCIKDFKIVRGIMSSADIEKDFEKYGEGEGGGGGGGGGSSRGVYHNANLGLISLSSDGENWITIADKNLGATQVYNDGDTLSEANCGKYYQWGNNYGFSFTGAVTTSSTQVNAQNYGPGNYYSNNTFRTGTTWDSSNNTNLWGGTIGTVEAMKGPCGDGFHIPKKAEATTLISILNGLGISAGDDVAIYIKIPKAGVRNRDSGEVSDSSSDWFLRLSTQGTDERGDIVYNNLLSTLYKCYGIPIRPFKDTPVVPDSSWTKLF